MLALDEEDEEDELLQSDMVVEPRFTASSEGGSDVESEARAHRHRPLYFAVGYAAPARSPCGSPSRLTLVDVLGWRPAKRRLCPGPRGAAVRLRERPRREGTETLFSHRSACGPQVLPRAT